MGKLGTLVAGAAIFGAGVLLADAVRSGTKKLLTERPLPRITVERDTTAGNTLYLQGDKCDWRGLTAAAQDSIFSYAIRSDARFVDNYVRNLSTEDQMNIAYISLLNLARKGGTSIAHEAERMKDAIGFRWNLEYKQDSENPFPIVER